MEKVTRAHLTATLLRKQILNMLKRLELNRVAGRVEEEHGGLLAWLALEADVRFASARRVRAIALCKASGAVKQVRLLHQ